MNSKIIGLIAAAGAALLLVVLLLRPDPDAPPVVDLPETARVISNMNAMIDEGTWSLLSSPLGQQRMRDDYGIAVKTQNITAAALLALEEVRIPPDIDVLITGADGLPAWLRLRGLPPARESFLYRSPLVILSWSPIAAAMQQRNMATPMRGSWNSYQFSTRQLIEAINQGASWQSLGVNNLIGQITLHSPNPQSSDVGYHLAALLLASQSQTSETGNVSSEGTAATVEIFRRQAPMLPNVGSILERYVKGGINLVPMMAIYESQLIDFIKSNPELWSKLEGQDIKPVILYPTPTIMTNQVGLALSDKGAGFLASMNNPQYSLMAWQRFGLRISGSVAQDVEGLGIPGIPGNIAMTYDSPRLETMARLLPLISAAIEVKEETAPIKPPITTTLPDLPQQP